jgi:hypothetical protein
LEEGSIREPSFYFKEDARFSLGREPDVKRLLWLRIFKI